MQPLASPAGDSGGERGPAGGVLHLVLVDEIDRAEDEDLAHHVRVLLVAAHESDHPPAGRLFDHLLEAPRITSWNSIRC